MFFNNGYPTVMTIMAKAVNGNPNVYFVRTVLKARSVTPLPQMLPKEIRAGEILNPDSSLSSRQKDRQTDRQTDRQFNINQTLFSIFRRRKNIWKFNLPILADLLLEEKRVMRGNKAVVENETVSKINLNTVVPLITAHPNRCSLRYNRMIHSGDSFQQCYLHLRCHY